MAFLCGKSIKYRKRELYMEIALPFIRNMLQMLEKKNYESNV